MRRRETGLSVVSHSGRSEQHEAAMPRGARAAKIAASASPSEWSMRRGTRRLPAIFATHSEMALTYSSIPLVALSRGCIHS